MLYNDGEHEVIALHPGPAPDFAFFAPPPQTAPERLADAEKRLLDYCVYHFAHSSGPIGDLVRSVIVRRAEISG